MAAGIANARQMNFEVALPADGNRGTLNLVLGLHCFLAAGAVAILGTFIHWCIFASKIVDISRSIYSNEVAASDWMAADTDMIGAARRDLRCVLALSVGGMLTFFLHCWHGSTAVRSTTMKAITENVYAIACLI